MYGYGIRYLGTFGIVGSWVEGWVEKKVSIVRCSTNSTYSSTIYKFRSGLAGWLKFYRPSTVSGLWVLGLAGSKNGALLFGALRTTYDNKLTSRFMG
jgi:uncharacterized membrane protein YeaQ/YmgE (transglycosylase-associated protein family)